MGKFILYGLLLVGFCSLANWNTLGRSAGSSYGSYVPRGSWIGGMGGGGFSSGGSGHK